MEEKKRWIEENNVTIPHPATKNRTEILKFFNPKLSLFREIVSSTLQIEVQNCGKPLLCLEADNGSGISALQWKKYLGEKVHVIAGEKQLEKSKYAEVCDKNGLRAAHWSPDTGRPTGEWTKLDQGPDTLHVSSLPVNVLLHQEAFNFIYLQPNNTITPYVDAVFTHLRHNGVVCFVSPNIASQCFRCPALIHRLFLAHVQKTEYVKEMAARIVIADIVRSATRHCRGVDILYTVCFEDHLLVAVRCIKKTKAAVDCAQQIRPILHCLMCEERVVYPDTHSPVELPYSLLPCDCKGQHPGKTAVILGPMWVGDIFNVKYLHKLSTQMSTQFPKSKSNALVQSIIREAICDNKTPPVQTIDPSGKTPRNKSQTVQTVDPTGKTPGDKSQTVQSAELTGKTPGDKSQTVENNTDIVGLPDGDKVSAKQSMDTLATVGINKSTDKTDNVKRPHDCDDTISEKRIKLDSCESVGDTDNCHGDKTSQPGGGDGEKEDEHLTTYTAAPLFYRNLHKQKYTGLPKSDMLVAYLHQEGFRASRTHFEDLALRTDATARQLENVIKKYQQQS